MKKSLLVIWVFFIAVTTAPVEEMQANQAVQTIPDEAIRLRILANSDDEKDQHIKHLVRDEVNIYIEELVQEMDDIEEARETIAAHLPELRDIVQETLEANDVTDSFTVDYREDVSFPLKVYDHYVYPAGEYEAVLITIGEGKGANWWCVLFPPLCFLDFSNGTTIDEDFEAEETNGDESTSNKSNDMDRDAIENATDDSKNTAAQDKEENEAELGDHGEEQPDDEEFKVSFFLFEWFGWS